MRAYPDTVVGGDIRAVAADVSPWQGSPDLPTTTD